MICFIMVASLKPFQVPALQPRGVNASYNRRLTTNNTAHLKSFQAPALKPRGINASGKSCVFVCVHVCA